MRTTKAAEWEIRQHNELTTACFKLNANELDLYFCLLAQLRQPAAAGTCYRLRLQDVAAMTGRTWNYQQFRKSALALRSRELILSQPGCLLQVAVAASVDYVPGHGEVEIELTEKIKPFLFNLKANFTSFRLQSALALTSHYAKRIYLLLCQWADKSRTRYYAVPELRQLLGVADAYPKFSALRVSVLEVALAQINARTEFSAGFETVGNCLRFHMTRRKAASSAEQLPLVHLAPDRLQTAQAHLTRMGIVCPKLCAQILTNESHLTTLFKHVYALQTGKLSARNPAGFFLHKCGLR